MLRDPNKYTEAVKVEIKKKKLSRDPKKNYITTVKVQMLRRSNNRC